MEGGELELTEMELTQIQEELFDGGQNENIEINPFKFLQHYMISPRKPDEFIPDNRQFDMYKRQVKIDIPLIRPVLIVGNIIIIATYLVKLAAN